MPADPLSFKGQSLSDKYTLVDVLGRGGMGVVYRGYHDVLDRYVAIKMILGEIGEHESAGFLREAKAAAKQKHSGIITVHDVGVHQGSYPYIVMELVEGESLADIIEREGALEYTKAAELLVQICNAVAHAHKHNVIHRDLKPLNILIEEDTGRAVVLDFGIAKVLDDFGSTKLTATGFAPGTLLYMSPEQCRGEKADARSDIYAIGCIAYEMLTSELPIDGENELQVIENHKRKKPASFKKHGITVPKVLEELVFQCLSKKPGNRPESTAELAKTLAETIGQKPEIRQNGILRVPKHNTEKSLLELAEHGDPEAQYQLGRIHAEGNGMKQDAVKAFSWYRKAAEQGHAEAQCQLGEMYENGKGVEKNVVKAVEWYTKAANQAHIEVRYKLGEMLRKLGEIYESGTGVKKDAAEAVSWFEKAAKQGDVDAQALLGEMYQYGDGIEKDEDKAKFWYRKAFGQATNARLALAQLKEDF